MESKHDYQILDNSNNHSKQHSDITSFYSTFDNFMKNKMKKGLSSKISQNEPYSFSKLMNSLYEFTKKKPDFELKMSTEKASIKKQKLFQGISLKNFNDSSSQKKHNILVRKLISTPSNGSKITPYSNKKFNINNNNNNNNEYKEDHNELKHYERLEKIILNLKDNIKNPDEFSYKCNEWIDEFGETKWGMSNVIKVNRRLYEINEKEKSVNLLISSIILMFLRKNQLMSDNNNPTIESNIKDLSDIMIIHHKIYLLLCYNLLLEKKINDDNNLFLIKQIKAKLPQKIYMNDHRDKNIYLEEEIKSCNKIFFKMLKSLLSIIENNKNNLLLNEINLTKLFLLNTSKLINLFKKLYHSKNNDSKNNNNNNLKVNTLNAEGTKSGKLVFSFRNKNSMKKHYLKDEKEINNFLDNRNTCNNFYLRNSHNSDILSIQNQSVNNKEFNFRESYYCPLKKLKTKINDETEKIIEIAYNNKKETLTNSYSCKNIGSKVESNKKIKINTNELLKNMNINKCLKDINKANTLTSKTKLNLNNKINININKKPKPPFLTSDILYSKFNKKNFTLILDLDETLIKFVTNINYPKGKIVFRPGLIQFLNKAFTLFDLIIWTIATKDYADEMINNIEKDKKYFSARLYRDHASYKNNIYVKDLSNLGRPLDKIIIIDDKESNFSFQRSNGILIRPFHGTKRECQNDYVLMDLYNILTKIIFDRSQDVRIGIGKYKKEIFEKISKINDNDLI